MTPLHLAVDGGHAAIIEVLLDAGADLEAGIYDTPLDLARNQKRTDIVDLLIQRGAVKCGRGSWSRYQLVCDRAFLPIP